MGYRFRMAGTARPSCPERGFTLLELLIVIVILSAVAMMALSMVGDDMNQVRYEDTRNRLDAIRKAVAGEPETMLPAGFVADNGTIPDDIDRLANRPVGWDEFGPKEPVFDPTLLLGGSGDSISLPYILMKGHRGLYLNGTVQDRENNARRWFRDGWGNRGGDDASPTCPSAPQDSAGTSVLGNNEEEKNHGWCVTVHDGGLYVDSYGMDGDEGKTNDLPYEEDMSMPPVLKYDWTATVAEVSIADMSRLDINLNNHDLRATLLVYVNGGSGTGRWRQVTTNRIKDDAIDSTDTARVDFSTAENIPMGEHLLVLSVDGNPDLAEFFPGYIPGATSPHYVAARVHFFPRVGAVAGVAKLTVR